MRKTREILSLVWLCGQSRREAARTCGVSKGTVDAAVNRATAAGLSWPLPFDLDDEALELRLYPPVVAPAQRKLSSPDWQSVCDELAKHRRLTLMLLWQEYKENNPSGYQYRWYGRLPSLEQETNHRDRRPPTSKIMAHSRPPVSLRGSQGTRLKR